ncbi:MAG: nucleotide sugar dehydrogenase [Acidimicrobiales bacterium]
MDGTVILDLTCEEAIDRLEPALLQVELLDLIGAKQAVVAIIGLGYVGLPLAAAFAEVGFSVVGFDVDAARVETINRGVSPIADVTTADLQKLVTGTAQVDGAGSLRATVDFGELSQADAILICVPTPVRASKEPDLSFVEAAAAQVAAHMKPGALVISESTTYPGTTEELILPLLEQGRGGQRRSVGVDVFLAFSPERIDPGRTDWTVRTTPKVVGGVTPACCDAAARLYGQVVETVVPVSKPRTAEMVKLLENSFRAVNIALANEMAAICHALDMDVWEVINAAKTKPFGFMPFFPGPGVGGHCIPVDPHYLVWKLRAMNHPARSIQLAMEINESMPAFVVSRVSDELNNRGKPVRNSRVLILGVAYKRDVADMRESPALHIIELLIEKGAVVSFHDPLVKELNFGSTTLVSVELSADHLTSSDCVIAVTDHSAYDWNAIAAAAPLLFDTRNVTAGLPATPSVVKL